jgi:hypothetical protein
MRANEFITERKNKRKNKKSLRKYFFPGYAYYGFGGTDSSGEGGGDGGGGESMYETAVSELVKELPSLAKHDYTTIDDLVRKVASKHRITHKALETLFKKQFRITPDSWIKGKLDENNNDIDLQSEVDEFVEWASKKLNLQEIPTVELSMDTEEAQDNHHTGGHVPGSGEIWVYANNRNLVDILRTVFHELVHVRQEELNMIKPGDSYPGSPIEAMADMLAGKYIKIYGEENHHIFQ